MKERCVKERGGSGGCEGEWWLAGMPRLMMRSRERSLICLPFYFTATHDVAEFGFFLPLPHCNSRFRDVLSCSEENQIPRRRELQYR